jgi:hypothetical protein
MARAGASMDEGHRRSEWRAGERDSVGPATVGDATNPSGTLTITRATAAS